MSTNAICFSKMHGLGNDFMVINTLNQACQPSEEQIRAWSNRHTGVGFDQLLLITSPYSTGDFGFRVYNADGSIAQQCGNGVRCLALYLQRFGLTKKKEFILDSPYGQTQITYIDPEQIIVEMGLPNFTPASLPFRYPTIQDGYELEIQENLVSFGAVSLGNPHIVIPVKNIETTDIAGLGAILSQHPAFPEQVNVGFMQIINPHMIKLKVFERGAGITLACGSGACAAMIIARLWNKVDPTCQVELPGGILTISWPTLHDQVRMTGPATWVFDGEIK